MTYKEIFQQRLKELMQNEKLSNRKLAKYIGVSDVAILKWKRGDIEPTLTNLCELSKHFNVSIDYLAGITD